MAKGWSFSALVAALKTAAFRDVGTSSGNVIEAGSATGMMGFGNLVMPAIKNFDWQTYDFLTGQVLTIDTATSVNNPSGTMGIDFVPGEPLMIQVVGGGTSLARKTLLVTSEWGSVTCSWMVKVSGTSGARQYRCTPIMVNNLHLDTTDLNTLCLPRHVGVYTQQANSGATTARNYPVASAGTLTVTRSGNTVMQVYSSLSGARFQRNTTNSTGTTWSDWIEFVSTKQRKQLETGSLEIFASTPFLDFHYGNTTADYDIRIINDVSGQLSIRAPSGVNTLWNVDNGTVRARATPGSWSLDWDNEQAAAYQVKNITIGPATYLPFISGKVTKSAEGYGTAISFGCITSEANSNKFQSPVIKAYTDNGLFKSWIFDITSGEIRMVDGNNTIVMATRNWVDSTFVYRDSISYVGLANADATAPYMRKVSDNSLVYLSTKSYVDELRNYSNGQFAAQDWITTVGLDSNDSMRPYMRRRSDNGVVYLASRDWASANFMNDMRYNGIGRLNIATKGADYVVPGGCAMVGWNTEGSDPVNDTILYSQLQRYVPSVGWLNIGRV